MSKARDTVEALRTVLVDGDVTNANFTGADLEIGKGGTGASTAGAARTALGLAIDSDVQAHDADTAKLDANANFTGTLQRGGTDVLVTGDVTNANFTGADLEIAKGGTGASSAGAARTALGLAIGTDVLAPNGSAANLTNLPASGAADFVASGTLPNGKPVVLKSDGTVEVVAGSSSGVVAAIPAGSEYFFDNSGLANFLSIEFDPSNANKFVIAYTDSGNSNRGTALVGTVSGATLSFGSVVVFEDAQRPEQISLSFDPNTANKFVLTYLDTSNSSYGKAIVGTLSGTSITFGSSVVFNSGTTNETSCSFDPNTAGKFVVAYFDGTNGSARVGTVSGTSISYGSDVQFNTGNPAGIQISFDPNTAGKFVLAYQDAGNSYYGTVLVGTLSGTSLSFGSEQVYLTSNASSIAVSYNPNTAGKFVVGYKQSTNSSRGTAVVGTVSGTTISYGTPVVFNSTGETTFISIAFDPNTAGKFVMSWSDNANSYYCELAVGTMSGTSLSFGSVVLINAARSQHIRTAFDPNTDGKFIVAYSEQSLTKGAAIVGQISTLVLNTNLTTTNFLGTSTAAYTDTQTAKIMLQGGISTNQSSLTIGSTYYVQIDGTLATTEDHVSVVAGKAISATTLLLKGI